MIGRANGVRIGITGLGVHVPARVVTNDDLAQYVETSDAWIQERTGIRERRMASREEALSDIALPAARAALEDAGISGSDLDLVIVATVTPDMAFPACSALIADAVGAGQAGAYDLSAGCTGFMYAVAQAYGMLATGLARRALVIGGDVLSKILDWEDRSTLILFGDGAGAVVMEPVSRGGFLGFELGADGAGGVHLWLPGSGSRAFDDPDAHVKMNGREVYKFATRIMVYSAEKILAECGRSVDEVDVYVPHQANKRIIDHAAHKLGIPPEKVVVNVDRYGNTSSGSIPLALADARVEGRLREGELVLMTGMGAGLTWGSALMEWTERRAHEQGRLLLPGPRLAGGREWDATSPGQCPRRWRSSGSVARPPASISSGSVSRPSSTSSSRPRCNSPRSWRRASLFSRRCACAGSSPTSSSAIRSASSRLSRPSARSRPRRRSASCASAASRWPRRRGSGPA